MKKHAPSAWRRKHRSRPTPRWLMKGEDLDRLARARCLMILNVLSGETPVSDAVAAAGISRGTYYQLETRALNGMLRALVPGAKEASEDSGPVSQIVALEAKVKRLERAGRRAERLLALTRKVVRGSAVTLSGPRTSSTRRGERRSTGSAERSEGAKGPSTPTKAGEAGS